VAQGFARRHVSLSRIRGSALTLRDFFLLSLICFVWGVNIVVTRYVVIDVPPLFYATLRFALIALVLFPLCWPAPRQWGHALAAAMGVGALNFIFLFAALATGTASTVAVALQLGLPFTTILSMLVLQEKIGWRRGSGMAFAFIGVVVLAYDPQGFGLSVGVLFAALAALAGSIGGIVMKRMEEVATFRLQAWVAMASWPVIAPLTLLYEDNQLQAAIAMGWPFWAALLFSAFVVSIFGHAMFYRLLRRYEATLIAPLTLLTPVWAVVLGVLVLDEPLTGQLLAGAGLALFGVGIIAVRPNARLPDIGAFLKRWQQ
jgi:O-acetylserine/cysteine efflux transporter